MKILLIADVGSNSAGFYHVGDEAMLYQTIQWYQAQYPEVELGVLSRSHSHGHWPVTESLHLPFPSDSFWLSSPWYCLHLIIRVMINRVTGLPVLKKTERAFIQMVADFDGLHFTGGGNIYSHHAPWLYYVFFLLFLGKWLRKKIWLTSQTIGPFNWFDGLLARFFLKFSDRILLRSKQPLFSLKTQTRLDAAYNVPSLPDLVLPQKTAAVLRIGLSVHELAGFDEQLVQVVVAALTQLAHSQTIELVILPHVFVRNTKLWDPGYMSQITRQLPPDIKVSTLSYQTIMESEEPVLVIKTCTTELDVLLATRYHALVFAVSNNVPVITFQLDEYYAQKNLGLLELVYRENWQRFVVSLSPSAAVVLSKKIMTVWRSLNKEKTLLKKCNKQVRTKYGFDYLHALISKIKLKK